MITESQVIHSPWLGPIDCDSACQLFFPGGLPGFEQERQILPVEIPAQRPIVYLQSVVHAGICFAALPVFVIDRGFVVNLADDERAALGIEDRAHLEIGADLLCLALLMPCGDTVEANLSAPVVVNLHNGRGIQCIAEPNSPKLFRLEENGKWTPAC